MNDDKNISKSANFEVVNAAHEVSNQKVSQVLAQLLKQPVVLETLRKLAKE